MREIIQMRYHYNLNCVWCWRDVWSEDQQLFRSICHHHKTPSSSFEMMTIVMMTIVILLAN